MAIGRVRVVLGLNKFKYLSLLSRSKEIYAGLDANQALLPSPNPPLSTLLVRIQDFEKAQQLVSTRVKGAAATRDEKRDALLSALECERTYVQSACDANPEQAGSLIGAAAMRAATPAAYSKPFLAATVGMPSGTVFLEANASLLDDSKRLKLYNWEYTLDGKTFLAMPATPEARTSISGLTPLTMVGFRVAVTVRGQPQGPWSQVVSILVR